jgi:hypothetical protein
MFALNVIIRQWKKSPFLFLSFMFFFDFLLRNIKKSSPKCSNNAWHLFSQNLFCVRKKTVHHRWNYHLNVCGNDATAYLLIISSFIDLLASHWFRRHHQIYHTHSHLSLSSQLPSWRQFIEEEWEKKRALWWKKKKKCRLSTQSQLLVKIMKISKLHKKSQTYHAICSIFLCAQNVIHIRGDF